MMLYGSQARNQASEDSDIDILVILHGPVHPGQEITRTGTITTNLSLKYDAVISCAFVSSERFQKEKGPFLLNISREGVIV